MKAPAALTLVEIGDYPSKIDTCLRELGFEAMMKPLKLSCADHEGARTSRLQQWNGKAWSIISDWYTADETVTDPIVKEVSAKYAAEKKIAPRDCSKEN
jgi:branched-chain amino acid transport system substrate-binding protein